MMGFNGNVWQSKKLKTHVNWTGMRVLSIVSPFAQIKIEENSRSTRYTRITVNKKIYLYSHYK